MDKFNVQIHLQRDSVKGYKNDSKTQRLTYDMTCQTLKSVTELNSVLKHFAARSRGEFQYWITGDFTASSEDPECKALAAEFEENLKS